MSVAHLPRGDLHPAFHALAHFYQTLADYHFTRALNRDDHDYYCFEYTHNTTNARILVAWLPTTGHPPTSKTLPLDKASIANLTTLEQMPLTADPAPKPTYTPTADNTAITLDLSESRFAT